MSRVDGSTRRIRIAAAGDIHASADQRERVEGAFAALDRPDLGSCLEIARSLREQIDWQEVRKRTADAPFAAAFFTLVEELGVVEARGAGGGG